MRVGEREMCDSGGREEGMRVWKKEKRAEVWGGFGSAAWSGHAVFRSEEKKYELK